MSQLMKKRFPSITSIDLESDGNTSFLRAARNGQLDKVLEHLKSNIDINTSNANGLNALHLASKDGHVDIVEELLKRGAVVDAATKKGNTALHIASLAGQEEVVKLLVQHGASVNVQSQNGFTPLYMAAQENHDNVVRYLLANGANQSLSTEDGFTPLAVAMQQGHDKVVTVLLENDTRGKVRLPALHIAAKKDDVKAAKLLLENEHNPDVTSKSGFTPLHIASHYGNEQIANLLIQKGADVNYSAKHNITPLHVAAKWGKTNMVTLLLENGATIESKTRDGLTPLHCAARSGHEQVVDMLLERGAPISSKTKNGLAPLHMAAQGDHVDAARILLYHRAPVDEVTVDYLTALHVAAHCGHVRVAKLLLDRQADANARALNGFTPLHIACKKNRIKVVELLLKHGASIGATTESGLTPLHVASFMGCMNIVIYLLQHDANPDVPTVRGETPLHLAARANQTDIIRILLRNGAQVDARAREQQTPLHIASRLGNVDIVMLLLQHGAKVDNTTKDMYTALHIASKEGQDEVVGVLLENGASLDATTKKGFSPLHLAAKYGHLKVGKLLLQKEAPVDAQGKNGVTPLHVASHYDHQNVALLLLDKGASPHATAKNGHTSLHIAARKNQMDIANTLLEYGAQPNAESKAGFTPLHLSAQECHAEMAALLLEHNAEPNYEAKNGLTPLHLCAQEDAVQVAEVLVKNGAYVNAESKAGYTPLHVASHYGQINMVRFLLQNGANIESKNSLDYTPLHQAAQQGHANIVNILLEHKADPNAVTTNGQTPLNIAQKLGYITVIETLKIVTTTITTTTTTNIEEKYRVQAPELMHETFMSDSEEEGGDDTVLGDQTYRYLTADEMKSLGDDSLPIDVTRDERIDSNRMVSSTESNIMPAHHIEDTISPEHVTQNYVEYIKKYTPDNVDISTHPINVGFLVSFLVDARGGAMRGCRHSGVRVIVPPRCAPSPTRITCRYVRPQRTPHPPPLMEGEALASRVLELGPVGAKFLGPVIIEVPHFAALRGKEREIVILRSDNGESWKEHTVEATEELLNEVLHDSFEAEDLNQLEDMSSGRITRILTQDFPQYFAVVSRVRQEVHVIGPEGGMVSSTVVPQVQALFPEGALTKKIKVGLQAQPIDPELTAKLLGHGVAVSPVVTVEPRRRKFHKAITLSMPAPRAHSQGMINQYSGSAPTLRLLCSITGGTTRAQWEDVTGSTPLTFVNDCVSFTTTVSARFWLMDCRNIGDATKMATELYKEAIHVPFMAKFVVFAKRVDPLEARLRVFCMTDDKEDKTLEHQEHFTEIAKSRDVEVLEGKLQYVEFAGNLVPITKSGEQLSFSFRAFKENRLPFSVRVKDQHAEAVSRCLFMREPKVPKGEPPQQPICILNIVLPDDIVTDTISLTDSDSVKRVPFLSEKFDYYRTDPRLTDMSNLLGDDWVLLANQLGLTSSEINVIKSEYPDSVSKQAQSMLRMWLSQSGNKTQTNTLENGLRRIGREDIIPQCLNFADTDPIKRIKHEEAETYRLKKDTDRTKKDASNDDEAARNKVPDSIGVKKHLSNYDKYSAEEKVVEKSDEEEEEAFDKPVSERREKIEKRLSIERKIPASSQRREIVQEITTIKQQSLVEDKIAEVQQKVQEQEKSTDEPVKSATTDVTVTPGTKTVPKVIQVKDKTSFNEISSIDTKTTLAEKTHTTHLVEKTHKTTEDTELLDGVTQSFERAKHVVPQLVADNDNDPKSPKLSKTPPPSPADFLVKERAAAIQEWQAERQPFDLESRASQLDQDAAQKETSCNQLAQSTDQLLTQPQSKQLPQPKPRTAKSTEPPLEISNQKEETTLEKPMSPVRDDFLDETELPESYSKKKLFWENISQESSEKIIRSNQETQIKTKSPKQDTHPPIPKPRTALPSSQSLIETDLETDAKASDGENHKPVKDRAVSFDISTSDSSSHVITDLTKISEIDISINKPPISEYQAAYQQPKERRTSPKRVESITKDDSFDSDMKRGSQSLENTGYISDSEDVEHYISDSEIEDRVPQIRDRMLSVFVPSTTSSRKSIYERSASLPTEDLYDISARNIQLRKAYFEEQIRKEMIDEQLTSEIEEGPSPERKTLLSSTEEEHTDADAGSISEDIVEQEDARNSVNKLAQIFETKSKSTNDDLPIKHQSLTKRLETKIAATSLESQESLEEDMKTSVKDLAKVYDKQLSTTQDGQVKESFKKTSLENDLHKSSPREESRDIITNNLKESTESELYTSTSEKYTHSGHDISTKVDDLTSLPTKKEADSDFHLKKVHSQHSISFDKSSEALDERNLRDDSGSTKPDSLEVLVDKSEIEDTEKFAELDNDLESKSIDSLERAESMKNFKTDEENYYREVIEHSNEQAEVTTATAKCEKQSPIYHPQEQIQDIVWEVSVQSHPDSELSERVEEIMPVKYSERPQDIHDITRKAIHPEDKDDSFTNQSKPEKPDRKEFKSGKTIPGTRLTERIDKFLLEERKVAESTPTEKKTYRESMEYKEMIDQQDEISEQLEAKLQQQIDEKVLESEEKEVSVKKIDDLNEVAEDKSDGLQDSCSSESAKIGFENHSEIKKMLLDSLHQQKVHPDKAKEITRAILGEIETEREKCNILPSEIEMTSRFPGSQISDFLKHLAETKGLDEREVELVSSVLARRQREPSKLTKADTQTSSMEITDEDLKYSGVETDYSNILEQMDQLKAEKISDDYESNENESQTFHKSKFTDDINEEHIQETESSEDFEKYDRGKTVSWKKDTITETTDSIKGQKNLTEISNTIYDENKTVSKSLVSGDEKLVTSVNSALQENLSTRTDSTQLFEETKVLVGAITDQESKIQVINAETKSEKAVKEETVTERRDDLSSVISANYNKDSELTEHFDDMVKQSKINLISQEEEKQTGFTQNHKESITESDIRDDGVLVETKVSIDKHQSVLSKSNIQIDKSHETVVATSVKIVDDPEKVQSLMQEHVAFGNITETKDIVEKSSMSELSTEKVTFETEISAQKDTSPTKASEVVFRKSKSEVDSSSSSSNLKADRKSGVEFEAYSSSGESHYHSFEVDSGKSRPCSSDVEGLVAAGSTDYESALTSQEYSAKSHITSTDYQTAISSISSKDSMKSLDSESSGNLASIEVSEHSETLVPSASDLEDILDAVDHQILDDTEQNSAWSNQGMPVQQSTEVSESENLSFPGIGESVDISEEDSNDKKSVDVQPKMKRSQEMTFQPEPKMLVLDSPLAEVEEKLGTSLEDGSVLSISMSSTSSTGAQKTVIELSRTDSEKQEGSMTFSGTSEHLSLDDVDNMQRGSKENIITSSTTHTVDISTTTSRIHSTLPIESVTITTSAIEENGIQSVSTQVTSETHAPPSTKPDEPRKKGHKRTDSSFISSMIYSPGRSDLESKIHSAISSKFKETSYEESKEIDESEKEENYEVEADQTYQRDMKDSRYLDLESDNEPDMSRPQSQFSKSDSERPTSTGFSDDKVDSELAELVKSSDVTEETDPIERPTSPEPGVYIKDGTPEFISDAQTSLGEVEQDYSLNNSKSHDIQMERKSVSSISEVYSYHSEKRESHGKSSSTSSEKSSFEEAEAEAAFSMVAHVSPAHKIKQICPILEDEDAEKHELETRERAQKEKEARAKMMKDISPGFIPDIKITQHMVPSVDDEFIYTEAKLDEKEQAAIGSDTPQTPASNSSKSSEETDQGREYILDHTVTTIQEEILADKVMLESKSETGTVVETTLKEDPGKETDSSHSDSFEMLEKPDLMDDFVVIEEVGKEAHEFDSEGKSMEISKLHKKVKKHDEEIEHYLAHSAPTPLTKMTDIKYYPDGTSSSEELGFDFEDSPPQVQQSDNAAKTSISEYGTEYDRELEANRKWIEQQFQGDQAAMIAAGYGYEMEFERGPLEDIKEEDINDFAASSYGSQRESGGSLKESYSSTPEYDVLAGRRYFTKSGEHDDVSMSSLQEFENLEKAMSLEMRKFHHGSQDSSSNGSFKNRYVASKSGHGDDISVSSLKEFEGLEIACIAAHKIEVKAKEEEAILSQIEEGQESVTSESESCETVSGTEKRVITDTDEEEDYEKRMFEIDEIIKQAQSNVERFIDLKEAEKTESLGRGDSIEEVSKVPDLDLDAPVKSAIKVQWKESDDILITSNSGKRSRHDSTDSLDQKTVGDVMTASTDSIEFLAQKSTKDNIMTDSIEFRGDEKSYMVSSDSLELGAATSSGNILLSDSIDEDGYKGGVCDISSSSTGKDFSSSTRDDDADGRADYMPQSIGSTDITSSTATHATCHYDTDSVYSGSFTSGGSNTMVSSTNSIDLMKQGYGVDIGDAVRKVWFEYDTQDARGHAYSDDASKPYVTEVIEPTEEGGFSHTITRRVEFPPEVRKVTFSGDDVDEQMKQFIRDFNEGEDCQVTEETDEHGNVHVKKVVQRRFLVKDDLPLSKPEIEEYFRQLDEPDKVQGQGVITRTIFEGHDMITKTMLGDQQSKMSNVHTSQLTQLTKSGDDSSSTREQSSSSGRAPVSRRRPLRYEISIEDQTEVDPREHDWRFNLPKHAEGEESTDLEEHGYERKVADQQQLSEEMKELLKELEKESKQ